MPRSRPAINFEVTVPDPTFCEPRYELDEDPDNEGFKWEDEHGQPCQPGDATVQKLTQVIADIDEALRDVPVLGVAYKYLIRGATYLILDVGEKSRRQGALRRSFERARRDSCLQATALRVGAESEFLAKNGYKPLLEFVASTGWLGFDSPTAANARSFVFGRRVPPWGLSPPELDLRASFWAKSRGYQEPTEVDRYDYFVTMGGGVRYVADTAADLGPVSGGWLPILDIGGPSYYGRMSSPKLAPELVESIRVLCTSHLPFHPLESWPPPRDYQERLARTRGNARSRCFLCLFTNLNLVAGLRFHGTPLGDVNRGFARIERRFAPELRYLRSRGVRVGTGGGGGIDAIRRFRPRSSLVKVGTRPPQVGGSSKAKKQTRAVEPGNTMLALGAAALFGVVWWKRRRR